MSILLVELGMSSFKFGPFAVRSLVWYKTKHNKTQGQEFKEDSSTEYEATGVLTSFPAFAVLQGL